MSSPEYAEHPPDHPNPVDDLIEPASIYENPWIRVREDQVLRPDGLPGIYGVVEFKNRAIGVLPVEDDGSVWLVGQYRYPLQAYSWEIPEGGGPLTESPEATARRELREETGLTAGTVELLATSHLSNSVSDELGYLFRATDLTHGKSDPEGTERIAVRRFEWSEAWQMLERGEITDSLSVMALLHEAIRRLASDPNRHEWSPLPCGLMKRRPRSRPESTSSELDASPLGRVANNLPGGANGPFGHGVFGQRSASLHSGNTCRGKPSWWRPGGRGSARRRERCCTAC